VTDDNPPDGPAGLSLSNLTEWLDTNHPGLRRGTLSASVIAGGRSNLTYSVTDGSCRWALRRPPLGHVLPTAHDMAREFRVLTALTGSAVPVATPVAFCDDREVLGEPFYLMTYVDGAVLDRPDLINDTGTARNATERLVDVLVALHSIDPAEVGLSDFGKPDGYLIRQVKRWHGQYEKSVPDGAALEGEIVALLDRHLPDPLRAGIVHGDYRLTNVIYNKTFTEIVAVVDWEMATLGDPLTDVGLLYAYHRLAQTNSLVMVDYPAEQGYLAPDQLVARYAAATGIDVSHLDWYIAFAYFKLSVIAAGIHARFMQGKTVGEGFDTFGKYIDQLQAEALALLAGA